jgi:hypothetical protein
MFWGPQQHKAKNGRAMLTSSDRKPMLSVLLPRGPGRGIYLALLGVFGVLVPGVKGLEFLDPVILIAYACLGTVFAGPAAVQLFDQVPKSVREAFGRVAAAVAFGEAMVVLLLAMGLATVRLLHRGIFPFDALTLLAGFALGAALSLAMASMAAWIRMTYSASVARSALRATFVVLLVGFVFRSRFLPDVAWMGAGGGLAMAAVFLALLARRVRT